MKKLTLFCAAFLLAFSLFSQEENTVVVVSTTGKVSLISQGKSKARPIQAGAVANLTSQLKFGPNATALVYCKGTFKEVKGPEKTLLSNICGTGPSTRPVNADYDFGEKMVAAVEMMAVARKQGAGWSNAVTDPRRSGDGWGQAVTDPRRSGDGWGQAVTDPRRSGDGWGNAVTDPRRSGDGWGGVGSSIRLIMPFGKLAASKTTFSWSRPATSEAYTLTILDDAGNSIHQVTVRDTLANIDLKSLNLAPEHIYRWKINVAGSKPMISNELEFIVGSEKDWGTVLKNAGSSPLASSTQSPSLRSLIEAIAMENNEWYYAAQQSYANMQKQYPDNLVRMMHSAFWMRYGFRRLAEKAARG
jgi:hypothetical protein